MNCNFNAAIKQYAYNELLSHPDDSVRIKSERELCTLYGISRPTVRKALAELEQEGVLIIRHGSGAFTNPAAAKYRQNPNWRRTVGILFAGFRLLFMGGGSRRTADPGTERHGGASPAAARRNR